MRWSCPHCGINLAVADEKLGSGWSFSRCYKCAGFALVRKSEVNLIKVDKAPIGENILLPEATETSIPMMSREATDNLEKFISRGETASAANKPSIKPAQKKIPVTAPKIPNAPNVLNSAIQGNLPKPLPEIPVKTRYRMLPAAIGITGTLAIASGIYLYIQGQSLWQKAHQEVRHAQATAEKSAPVRQVASIENNSPNTASAPILAAQTTGIGEIVTDQVRQSAMAPARPSTANPTLTSNDADSDLPEVPAEFTVRIRNANGKLRSGPGMQFPVLRIADTNIEYTVTEWRDRWFKIAPKGAENPDQLSAWIRNDLVQMTKSN